jgi:predicted 2-oxoglutarate/Fe(II)-dependent dioxygenase YbiX
MEIKMLSDAQKGFFKEDIIYFNNFIPQQDCKKLVQYYKNKTEWSLVAFYESYGMNMVEDDEDLEKFGLSRFYLKDVAEKMQFAAEEAHSRKVKRVSTHAQKWEKGAYANFHSDNSDMDGNPSAWEVSKFVCLLYLNSDYSGGQLDFRDHDICISPDEGMLITFPGGIENIHAVKEVTSGTRYTLGSFWDYAEAEYSEDRKAEWKKEKEEVEKKQAKMYAEWKKEK